LGNVNVGTFSLEARRVDGLFSEADLFSLWSALEAWSVNSGTADTNFFSVLLWLESRRVYSSLEVGFFTVAWLEAGTVFTLGDVDLGTFVSAALRTFDVDSGIVVVMMSSVWKLEVDVG
jgi:hypothetical protein